jgi:hypothetical protein
VRIDEGPALRRLVDAAGPVDLYLRDAAARALARRHPSQSEDR